MAILAELEAAVRAARESGSSEATVRGVKVDLGAQMPAPGVFEPGRNQVSENDRPPPAGFRRLTAEQKQEMSAQAGMNQTQKSIYGFGLAADRGPKPGAADEAAQSQHPGHASLMAKLVAVPSFAAGDYADVYDRLVAVFGEDWTGADRWLSDRCGPLGSTPIKALEDGRTEKVIAYLEAAAP